MDLLPKEVLNAFAKQGCTAEKSPDDIKIVVKLFNPCGAGTWYLYDKEDDDIFWAFVNLGDHVCAECGTVSMSELKEYRGPLGIGIERDRMFKPLSMSLREVINTVKRGGHV